MKIYDTDPEVFGRTSTIKAQRTKTEIDGVLAKFGIKDVLWHSDFQANDVFVVFKLPPEKFGNVEQALSIKLEPPRIWHKNKHGDEINWDASMRNLFWYIQTHLSQAYVMQSSKFTEFLPHILTKDGSKVVDSIKRMYALPEYVEEEKQEPINITPEVAKE